ncbi:MAG: SctF chaperone SctG [Chlamydiae bacterium]|nr:SctF chaperone SctG [Chlamydiota bacterium]
MDLKKYKDHFIVMVEAGFIAVNQADEDCALKLFKAASLLDPNNQLPNVGLGYMHLCKLELKEACRIFNEILQKEPTNEMAKTFLGLSMSLDPKEISHGEKILEQSAEGSKDPAIKTLAHSAIEFVEKFVKKKPTPTQGTTKHEKR